MRFCYWYNRLPGMLEPIFGLHDIIRPSWPRLWCGLPTLCKWTFLCRRAVPVQLHPLCTDRFRSVGPWIRYLHGADTRNLRLTMHSACLHGASWARNSASGVCFCHRSQSRGRKRIHNMLTLQERARKVRPHRKCSGRDHPDGINNCNVQVYLGRGHFLAKTLSFW